VRVFSIVETASKSEARKQFKSARAWALANNVRHIVFLSSDREARNLKDNEENEVLVRQDRMVLHYAQDRKVLHKYSPDSDFFMRDVSCVTNKHYSRVLATKVKDGTQTKAESGWFPSTHLPDGYVHQKLKDDSGRELRRRSIIVLDPNKLTCRRVLREFELRAEGCSLYAIRKQVIAEKLVPLEGRAKYHVSGIDRRLKSKFYIGRFDWRGVEYTGMHELFVPDELFWAVQATFGIKSPYVRPSEGVFGGGWLRCANGDCGCHIVYDPKKKLIKETGTVKVYKFYHCTNGKKVHPTMKGMTITEEKLFEQFEPAVDSISITEVFAKQVADALNETQKKARRAHDREAEGYRTALAELEGAEDEAYKDFKRGVLDDEQYRRAIKNARSERARVTELMNAANKTITDVSLETAKSILELAVSAKSLWVTRTAVPRQATLEPGFGWDNCPI
jgi:hypothetical protein